MGHCCKFSLTCDTVEPLKRGHFGEFAFVLCREVVLFLEVPSAECVLYVFYNSKRLNTYKTQKVAKKGMNRIVHDFCLLTSQESKAVCLVALFCIHETSSMIDPIFKASIACPRLLRKCCTSCKYQEHMSAAKRHKGGSNSKMFANPSVVESHLCKLPYMENLCELCK